ncbi:conserved Plasmodium protein, unknown function [Plasmodium relictum]|uniref:Uncharacterized protein n=1 Tax=Plasmodium relictum TaxID=85471 RepID=A0A1J1HA69_PLARL|nr:conserved Plasmodium protein, unknown function [Plasmodium relictum]CRH01712.1 conserved Plasmodium protein, unknown function [Plasmodium relictum]
MNLSIGKIDFNNIYVDILNIQETLVSHIQNIVTHVYKLIEKAIYTNIEKRELLRDKYDVNFLNDANKKKMTNDSIDIKDTDEDVEKHEINVCVNDLIVESKFVKNNENHNLNKEEDINSEEKFQFPIENSQQNVNIPHEIHNYEDKNITGNNKNNDDDNIKKIILNNNIHDIKTIISDENKNNLNGYNNNNSKNILNELDDNIKINNVNKGHSDINKSISNEINYGIKKNNLNENSDHKKKCILNVDNYLVNKNIDNILNENKLKLKKHIALLELIKYVILYSYYSSNEKKEIKSDINKKENINKKFLAESYINKLKGNIEILKFDLNNDISNYNFCNFDLSNVKIKYINIINYYMELLSPFNKFYDEKNKDNKEDEKNLKVIRRKLDEIILNYDYIIDEILKKNNFSELSEEYLSNLKKQIIQGNFPENNKSGSNIKNEYINNMYISSKSETIEDKKLSSKIKNISNNLLNNENNSILSKNIFFNGFPYAFKNINENLNNNFLYKMNIFNNHNINDINFDYLNKANIKTINSLKKKNSINKNIENIYTQYVNYNSVPIKNISNVKELYKNNLNYKNLSDLNKTNLINLNLSDIKNFNAIRGNSCENINNEDKNLKDQEQINYDICSGGITNNKKNFKSQQINDLNNKNDFIPLNSTNGMIKEYICKCNNNNSRNDSKNENEEILHYNCNNENLKNFEIKNQIIDNNKVSCMEKNNINNMVSDYKNNNKKNNEITKNNVINEHGLFSIKEPANFNKNNKNCDFLFYEESNIKNDETKLKYNDKNKTIGINENKVNNIDEKINISSKENCLNEKLINGKENKIHEYVFNKNELNHKIDKLNRKTEHKSNEATVEEINYNGNNNFKDQSSFNEKYNFNDVENYNNIYVSSNNMCQLNSYNNEDIHVYSKNISINTSKKNINNEIQNYNKIHDTNVKSMNSMSLNQEHAISLLESKDNYKNNKKFETIQLDHSNNSNDTSNKNNYNNNADNDNNNNNINNDYDSNNNNNNSNNNDNSNNSNSSNNNNNYNRNNSNSNNNNSNTNNNNSNNNKDNNNNNNNNNNRNNSNHNDDNNDDNNNNNSNSTNNNNNEDDNNNDSNDNDNNYDEKEDMDKKNSGAEINNSIFKNNIINSLNNKFNLDKDNLHNPYNSLIGNINEDENIINIDEVVEIEEKIKNFLEDTNLIEKNKNNIKEYTNTNEFNDCNENLVNNDLNNLYNFYNNINSKSMSTNIDIMNNENFEKMISNDSLNTFENINKDIIDLNINNNLKNYNNDIMNNEIYSSYFDIYSNFNEKNGINNNLNDFDKSNIEYDLMNFANNTYIDIHKILQNNDILKNEFTNIEESFKLFPNFLHNKKIKSKHPNEDMLEMYNNYKNMLNSEGIMRNEDINQLSEEFFFNHNLHNNIAPNTLTNNMINNDFDNNINKILDIMNTNNDIHQNNMNNFSINEDSYNDKKNENTNFSYNMNNYTTDMYKKSKDKKRKISCISNNDVFPDGSKIENILENSHAKKCYKNSEDKKKKYQKIDIRTLNKNVQKNKEICTNCYIHYDNFKSSYILTFINRKQKKQRKIFPVEPNEKDEAYIIQIMKYIEKLKDQDKIYGVTKNEEIEGLKSNQINLNKNEDFFDINNLDNMNNKVDYIDKNYFLNNKPMVNECIDNNLANNNEINTNNVIALNNKMNNFISPFNDQLYLSSNNINYMHGNISSQNNINNTNCLNNMNPNIPEHLNIYNDGNIPSNVDFMNFHLLNDTNNFENFNLINTSTNNNQNLNMFYINEKKNNLVKSINDNYLDEVNMMDNMNNNNYNSFPSDLCENILINNMKNIIYPCENNINTMKSLKNNHINENDEINSINILSNINISNFPNISTNNESEIMQKYNSIMNEYDRNALNNSNYSENSLEKNISEENSMRNNV